VSLANLWQPGSPTNIADLLINHIGLAYHPNLMGAAGSLAVDVLKTASASPFILAVEGGIPTAFGGHACTLWTDGTREVTAMEAVSDLAPRALAILSVGTCSSFGGIPAGVPNPAGVVSVSELTGIPTINIAGCPTHPDWIVWTVAQLLAGNIPSLGEDGRPMDLFFGEAKNVHKNCPRSGKEKALYFGDNELCLKGLGCKGPQTQADCPGRKWNKGVNWCIGASSPCIACTESGFPDKFSPLYYPPAFLASSPLLVKKAEWRGAEQRLQVEGKGSVLAAVYVKDADSGTILGSTSVDRFATWKMDIKPLANAPIHIRVESIGEVVVSPVSIIEPTITLQITKAEWRSDTLELRIEGKAAPGKTVILKDAYAGTTLGSIATDLYGKWVFKSTSPKPIPTRVRVESDGSAVEMDVMGAPIVVEITLAEYSYDTLQLRVTGNGSAGHIMMVTDALSGLTLGSQTVAANGVWSITVASPNPIPARVRATSEGIIAERDIVKIGTPPEPLIITRAEYNKGRNRLKVEGTGGAGKTVIVRDAATLTTYGSSVIDSRGRWKFEAYKPVPVPTRVRAECSGQVIEMNVIRG
jgi:hydrogenase small subunit